MNHHRVAVSIVKVNPGNEEQHQCAPTESKVEPGDTMQWDASEPLQISFPNGSPFVEGAGPFKNGQVVTVKSKPPLQGGEVFVGVTSLSGTVRKTQGNIKVT